MRQDHGAAPGPKAEQAHPTTPSSRALPAAFMDRLMGRVDPHRPPLDEELRRAQRACGRWLALRRLQIGLTSKQLAGMAGVSVEHLQLIEAGLADPSLLPEQAQQPLSRLIAQRREDFDWVAGVIAIASGRGAALPAVMDRVIDELDAIDDPTAQIAAAPAAGLAPQDSAEPAFTPAKPVALDQTANAYEVLRILAGAESYTYAIWEQVRRVSRHIGIAEIGDLLDRMRAGGLIEESKEPLFDPALDSEPLQLYQMTAGGRRAYDAERLCRAYARELAEKARRESSATAPDPTKTAGLETG